MQEIWYHWKCCLISFGITATSSPTLKHRFPEHADKKKTNKDNIQCINIRSAQRGTIDLRTQEKLKVEIVIFPIMSLYGLQSFEMEGCRDVVIALLISFLMCKYTFWSFWLNKVIFRWCFRQKGLNSDCWYTSACIDWHF